MDVSASLRSFSVVQGGPFFQITRRLHLNGTDRGRNVIRSAAFFAFLGWGPVFIATLFESLSATQLLHVFWLDAPFHVRMLWAVPLFMVAEPIIDRNLRDAIRYVTTSGLLQDKDLPRLDRAAKTVSRCRDSVLTEGIMLGLALAPALALHVSSLAPAALLTELWALPLFRFLLLRWFWRAGLWTWFLFKLSCCDLVLVPTHPDLCGGLGLLANCQTGFSVVVLALGSVLIASMAFGGHDATPISFNHQAKAQALFGALSVAWAYLPLLCFSPRLIASKRTSDEQFSLLARRHSRDFEQKWFRSEPPQPLGSADFSSQTDLATSFTLAHNMRLIPVSRRALVALTASAFCPFFFLLVVNRQALQLLMKIF